MGGTGCRSAAKGVQSIKDASSFYHPQVNMTYDWWHHFSSFRFKLYSSIWDSGNNKNTEKDMDHLNQPSIVGGMLAWGRVPFRELTHIPLVGGEKKCHIGSFPHIGMKIPSLISGSKHGKALILTESQASARCIRSCCWSLTVRFLVKKPGFGMNITNVPPGYETSLYPKNKQSYISWTWLQ